MTEQENQIYTDGEKAAYRSMLTTCLRGLGYDEKMDARWSSERHDATKQLKEVCELLGVEWPGDDFHLADVVSKYVKPAVREIVEG